MLHSTPIRIVWFKRDLRVADHAPLAAASTDPVLPLYIFEPEYWALPDTSDMQQSILLAALSNLNASLSQLGVPLLVKTGDAVDVFVSLLQAYNVTQVVSHEETGNAWTFARDQKLAKFFKAAGVSWVQYPSNGVIRKLSNRDGWSKHWHQTMNAAVIPAPKKLQSALQGPIASDLPGFVAKGASEGQSGLLGTRDAALAALDAFLQVRGERYHLDMSSPITAETACSRLSIPLSLGLLSMKEVYQTTQTQIKAVRADRAGFPVTWPKALQAFGSRLRWHCHFIQKLEDEPQIEFKTMHPAYEALRETAHTDRLHAWQAGCTGYPMVDACMRYLKTRGWLNFRMRAMLVSFASYHLWLDWRQTAPYLASLFADYEPGIHYSQVQMQSGTTGMNAVRIYNPIKQGFDQDPTGAFIRQWVPELASADNVHEPWKNAASTKAYPGPIVSEPEARQSASSKIYAVRRSDLHRAQAQSIVAKHGSRSSRRFNRPNPSNKASAQRRRKQELQSALALE